MFCDLLISFICCLHCKCCQFKLIAIVINIEIWGGDKAPFEIAILNLILPKGLSLQCRAKKKKVNVYNSFHNISKV